MKRYYGYIRVSTQKQGEKGSSLGEQKAAINGFAKRHGCNITAWFEERETAAKSGRTEFNRMLKLLRARKADGVVFHKIDRGARNLKDWTGIQDLLETGLDVQFAHESLDLRSRGGRLTADLLAVIAADFIRNLRDEVRKGMHGRLKQGLYPMRAPIGYLDQGGGQPKIIDPSLAPFVRFAFQEYAVGKHSLRTLADEMYARGFRQPRGRRFHLTVLHKMLRNPFYAGVIRIQRTGEVYTGVHQPLISLHLFQDVQRRLVGKSGAKVRTHELLFRRQLRCNGCSRVLVGEMQKGNAYYRCHSAECKGTSLSEASIHKQVLAAFDAVHMDDEAAPELEERIRLLLRERLSDTDAMHKAQTTQREHIVAKLSRLTDLYLEGGISREDMERKREELVFAKQSIENQLRAPGVTMETLEHDLRGFVEQAQKASLSYICDDPSERRAILKSLGSNFSVQRKYVAITLDPPFQALKELHSVHASDPSRNNYRTRLLSLAPMIADAIWEAARVDAEMRQAA